MCILMSRKKRATEAAKLVEAAKRWERVDGGLAGGRGRNNGAACANPRRVASPSGMRLQSAFLEHDLH